ncbi:hypothetical protein B0O80DRAFT_449011 [Mortierella sp. GBAus27b]|nr:hypothetical protein B0O80DRAFT_449011 [Mortierella sp. GBAus27b]
MATSTLQLMPSDIFSSSSGYERVKTYSTCLRCRQKKVKCDRKVPCSRCEKHHVDCSYSELASVQLDIRPFQQRPKNRRDPLITSPSSAISTSAPSSSIPTASPTNPSSHSHHTTTTTTASNSSSVNGDHNEDNNSKTHHGSSPPSPSSPSSSPSLQPATSSAQSSYDCPLIGNVKAPARVATQKSVPTDPSRTYVVIRKKQSKRSDPGRTERDRIRKDVRDISEHVDRVRLSDSNISTTNTSTSTSTSVSTNTNNASAKAAGIHLTVNTSVSVSSRKDHTNHVNVPVWRVQQQQPEGKHKHTAHEQDMADSFGLAAFLKAKEAKEMEISQDSGRSSIQPAHDHVNTNANIDYEMEPEHTQARRTPTSMTRPDRTYTSRARKYTPIGYNPTSPYARPPHCQLAPLSSSSSSSSHHHHSSSHGSNGHGSSCGCSGSSDCGHSHSRTGTHAQPPASAQCCCQIAAMQGQTLGSCPYNSNSNVSYGGYENHSSSSSSSCSRRSVRDRREEPVHIAYSPKYSPRYCPPDAVSALGYGPHHGHSHSHGHRSYSPPLNKPLSWQLSPSSPPSSSLSSSPSSSAYPHHPSSVLPPLPPSPSHSAPMNMEVTSPRTELPPIRWNGPTTTTFPTSPTTARGSSSFPDPSSPTTPSHPMSTSMSSSTLEVGHDEDIPVQQICKYNEPNVDVWDMIEKPISGNPLPTTKHGRSMKMEMKWILS